MDWDSFLAQAGGHNGYEEQLVIIFFCIKDFMDSYAMACAASISRSTFSSALDDQ